MNKIDVDISKDLNETTYSTTLDNGLQVYICKKEGYNKKIGMFGTKYGSVINEFIDITNNKRVRVPDGVAHFLEHKLFEQEGANALDLFSKIGVSSNAYTSFDHTVYYFETIEKYEEALELLIKLVRTPYFTDENVEKEQGIIGQEISMYDDEPSYKVYFNTLQAMYNSNPVKIDIAGTIESISNITKDTLYTCYNTFYSLQNMFFIVIGDVDVEKTIKIIENNVNKYEKANKSKSDIVVFNSKEDKKVNKKLIEQSMDVYMQEVSIGYKLEIVEHQELIKRQIVADIISDMYFSKLSKFYEDQYALGLLNDDISFSYEGSRTFSHVVVIAESKDAKKLANNIIEYIDLIKNQEIDKKLFDLTKKKKIGEMFLLSDRLDLSYRRVIDKILNETKMYDDVEIIKAITVDDIKNFLGLLINDENMVVSVIKQK